MASTIAYSLVFAHGTGTLRSGDTAASSHPVEERSPIEFAKHGIHAGVIQKGADHAPATTQYYIEVSPDQERLAVASIEL